MRHRNKIKRLGRDAAHRKSLLINLSLSLIKYGRITTTLRKAKETQKFIERIINVAKKGDLSSKRYVARYIKEKQTYRDFFKNVVPHFENREGGYTRIFNLGYRKGDSAEMALIELVKEETKKEEKK